MCFTLFFSSATWAVDRLKKIEQRGAIIFSDPFTFISGGVAGAVGRAAALPLDRGGNKGAFQAVYRRIPQWGIVLWLYVPLSQSLNHDVKDPNMKAFSTFFIGALAGFVMRLICNPVNRVRDEAARMNVKFIEAARIMRGKTYLQFFYCTPPLLANAVYFGALFTVFEGLRRLCERNGAPVDNIATNALVNGTCAAAATTIASTLTFPFSAGKYANTVIHDSALIRGLKPTLMKEVPMAAVTFTTFSLLQPIFAPHHGKRVGFGY